MSLVAALALLTTTMCLDVTACFTLFTGEEQNLAK